MRKIMSMNMFAPSEGHEISTAFTDREQRGQQDQSDTFTTSFHYLLVLLNNNALIIPRTPRTCIGKLTVLF